ncbi:MAG: substrate-binding domain-containing protein [Clostridia bacterium]|nr:substrate-binding domain-containing protein [Clostridia bacterium]MBR2662447.1 substrate-binding domain-containing protein [Clostridia bacterium]
MKKILALVLALAMVLAATAALADGIKVGIINLDPSESGYREANVKKNAEVFSTENGYDPIFITATDVQKQVEAINTFVNEQVDYILISAANDEGYDEALEAAKTAGVKVILFDRMIACDADLYEAAVVSDMRLEGETAVKWLESLELDEYKVLHIQGQLGSAAQKGRSEPLQEKCEADEKWTMVREGTGGDKWDPNEARTIAEAAINAGEDFNIVYAENDGMAAGVVAALDKAGIEHGVGKKVIVMGFDCNKWALKRLLDQEWNYDGQCNPFVAPVIDEMIKKIEAGESIADMLNDQKQYISVEVGFDARTITQEDIDTYGLGKIDEGAPVFEEAAE